MLVMSQCTKPSILEYCLFVNATSSFIHCFFHTRISNSDYRPREKKSTEVRITQNKGKERENSYQKLSGSNRMKSTVLGGHISSYIQMLCQKIVKAANGKLPSSKVYKLKCLCYLNLVLHGYLVREEF